MATSTICVEGEGDGMATSPLSLKGKGGMMMRKQIISIAEDVKMTVFKTSIMPSHLLAADEVLLTNAIQGVCWVDSYKSKQYTNTNAQNFINLLNEKWS